MGAAFWATVNKDAPNGCWEITGPHAHLRAVQGIPSITERYGPITAPRVAYALRHGSVPAGKFVQRGCGNVRCVNPDHLRLSTNGKGTGKRHQKDGQRVKRVSADAQKTAAYLAGQRARRRVPVASGAPAFSAPSSPLSAPLAEPLSAILSDQSARNEARALPVRQPSLALTPSVAVQPLPFGAWMLLTVSFTALLFVLLLTIFIFLKVQ
jgi:hypothetical protein